MATEEGVVIRVNDGGTTAWVKTVRSSACKSCSSRGSCTAHGSDLEMEVEALNPISARTGDRVVISIRTSTLLSAAFQMYILPILFMLAGALAGESLAGFLQMDPVVFSTILGISCFALSILLLKYKTGSRYVRERYQPRIIRVLPALADS